MENSPKNSPNLIKYDGSDGEESETRSDIPTEKLSTSNCFDPDQVPIIDGSERILESLAKYLVTKQSFILLRAYEGTVALETSAFSRRLSVY